MVCSPTSNLSYVLKKQSEDQGNTFYSVEQNTSKEIKTRK